MEKKTATKATTRPRTTKVEESPPTARRRPQEARTGTLTARKDEEDARYRRLREDDLETWAETGGDLSLWPRDWNKEPTAGGARNPLFIPRNVRPYYFRSAERDAEVMRAWPEDRFETPDSDVYGEVLAVDGFPVTLSGRDPELVTHWFAMYEARARIKADGARRGQAVRDALNRCEICGEVRSDVAGQAVGDLSGSPVEAPPRVCAGCMAVAEIEIEERRRARAEMHAAEVVEGVPRSERVKVWIDEREGRIMGA
ncbi:hypothetical protein ASC77_22225 [Nocardioides sp. Root1257]|uniref:hypothetical protein n=1 Tax=unclassified Nocardioides TaxID=2615069 RepID=UPI0006F769ED|nr:MULTISPECIES: hypothetical protein [unclassified Nocardioides]KQW43014.1 hypothetical protein ASC77_22225 [Nocardioides sp. Root1257]KRC41882.1 hypothetical protein ASE24_22015 [Nocardioides sp. Root224]